MDCLEIRDLSVALPPGADRPYALQDVTLTLERGKILCVVGESGSGKSMTASAVMRLLPEGVRVAAGQVLLAGEDLLAKSEAEMRRLRGARIAMIFQEPMTALNPLRSIGDQIGESFRIHTDLDGAEIERRVLALLEEVRIPDPRRALRAYPHELSGGQRQRAMIAMALALEPEVLIADEPTTALDVTVQAQVLRLIRALQKETDLGMIFITHDMGVVAEIADRVVVMRRGEQVEEGEVGRIFAAPRHPYTQRLLAAVPVLGSLAAKPLPEPFAMPDVPPPEPQDTVRPGAEPVLEVRDLTTRFDVKRGFFGRLAGRIHAAEKVSFALRPGETLAVVGESGCGKSTTGRSIIRLEQPIGGEIRFAGEDMTRLDDAKEARLRRGVQFVFQDPFASLDPRLTVGFSVAEPILTHRLLSGRAVQDRVAQLLTQVGLGPEHARRYPHELSGGQRQRVCIARALASEPQVIIADESVAALDVSIRAQVVNLMMRLQREMGLAYLFISHDMAVVERISHRVAVMYLGQVVEIGPRQAVMNDPQHPYTKRLLAAVPVPDPARRGHDRGLDDSEVPSPLRRPDDPPEVAPLVPVGPDHFVARHHVGGLY